MATLKCKMCGGSLEINNNEAVAVCEYCGTQQTIPKSDDEKRIQLYDRANYFRRENEFDKAMGIYEMILTEEQSDSEAYWGIVLCRYGIEYVEDPRTHKRIPTVNRAQFTSIFDDADYKKAIECAGAVQKRVYEEEAEVIDKIQKGILEISNKEAPFDVFICYKETDAKGNRTQDSVYAQDIYTALTKEGYKVFFSRITLENKLGSAYEPYIFAALNSARVMLVIGTSKENFNAVWVKNEWSRYLNLIKAGKEKTLIPIYKDISPYDMPEEFQYLQSQDMGKIGYIQDILHGIAKLIPLASKTESNGNVENQVADSMLKKAFNFIASGDYKSATLCLDTVHAYEPDNAMYYVGQLLIEYNCTQIEKLAESARAIVDSVWYKDAVNYADEKLKATLQFYGTYSLYNELSIASKKVGASDFKRALKLLGEIDYGKLLETDSELAIKIKGLKEILEKQAAEKEEEERIAAEKKELAEKAREVRKKRLIKISVITIILACLGVLAFFVVNNVIIPKNIYSKGNTAYETEDYTSALVEYSKIKGFEDVDDKIFSIEQSGLKYSQVGDIVSFGVYNINGGSSRNKNAPIEWIVLERNADNVLLISKDCLVAKTYHSVLEDVSWNKSSLSLWLKNDFKNYAFSEKEKECLLPNVDVTILSINQLKTYLTTPESRVAAATSYAKQTGIQVAENGNSCWWTRSDTIASVACPVLSTGSFGGDEYVTNVFIGVRPVINVRIEISSEEASEFTEKRNSEIYKEALELYKKGDLNKALKQFIMIPEYKDSQDYIYDINLKAVQHLFDSGDYAGYQVEIKSMKEAGYEPAVKAYNQAQDKIDAIKAKEDADKKAAEDAITALNGTWHWQNFFSYYMEIENGVISYGTNADHSINNSSEVWIDNVGTIEYDLETNSYIVKDFNWAVKLTYDGSTIRMYDEYGDPASFFDEYAVRV